MEADTAAAEEEAPPPTEEELRILKCEQEIAFMRKRIQRHAPNDPDLRLRLGEALVALDRPIEALPHLEWAVSLGKSTPEPVVILQRTFLD